MFKKTKEKINQNEYIVFIKKMWEHKRYRSLLVLALYFIFFFIIITGLRSTYQDSDVNNKNNNFSFKNIKEEYNNLRDYSYEIFVNEESLVLGNLDNGINSFKYQEKNYTIINNNIYTEEDGDLKKVELENNDILLSIIEEITLNNLIEYVFSLDIDPEVNETGFKLDYLIPNAYFSLNDAGNVNVIITGNTKVEEINVNLTEYMNKQYIIKVKVSDNDD